MALEQLPAMILAMFAATTLCDATWAAEQIPIPSRVWFEPELRVDNDPACATILRFGQNKFLTNSPWWSYPAGLGDAVGPLRRIDIDSLPFELAPEVTTDTGQPTGRQARNHLIESGGERLYLRRIVHGGCGGACETMQIAVSSILSTELVDRRGESTETLGLTPTAAQWQIYADDAGHHYAIGMVDNDLQAYRISIPGAWGLTCAVSVEPAAEEHPNDEETEAAEQSITRLLESYQPILGGGYCGSSNTSGRWYTAVSRALKQALFRPWALVDHNDKGWVSENTWGDYSRSYPHLVTWSLGGLMEYHALAEYERQLGLAIIDVSRFYVTRFGWSRAESEQHARQALTAAIAQGLGFYLYSPIRDDAEREFRQAVLEQRPIEEIRAIQLNPLSYETPEGETLLNIAVAHPEALAYLLERGMDPSKANAFGKTPLMYAVQYNQLESVRMLVEGGADINASTFQPNDTCQYGLATTKVTALHYAARYGSADLIRFLVRNGAATYAYTESDFFSEGESALRWLQKYTTTSSTERNENILESEIPRLLTLLKEPSTVEREDLSLRLTLQAESEYAAGRAESAYRLLHTAVSAHESTRALRDLSLVALSTGRPNITLETATALIKTGNDPMTIADAWFNLGLACERFFPDLQYDRSTYCTESDLYPFLMSWQAMPTPERRRKIEEKFKDGSLDICVARNTQGQEILYHFWGKRALSRLEDIAQIIYVLHPAEYQLDPTSIRWNSGGTLQAIINGETVSPLLFERIDMGDAVITVLRSRYVANGDVSVGGNQTCPL